MIPHDVAMKVRSGHQVEPDHPGGLSSVRRWTCRLCGDAVLDYQGNTYGSATERPCKAGEQQ